MNNSSRSLKQCVCLFSKHPVPMIICNYEGFYDGLIAFLSTCETNGTVAAKELADVMLASSNEEVLETLAQFYHLDKGLTSSSRHQLTRVSDIMTGKVNL